MHQKILDTFFFIVLKSIRHVFLINIRVRRCLPLPLQLPDYTSLYCPYSVIVIQCDDTRQETHGDGKSSLLFTFLPVHQTLACILLLNGPRS